MGIVCKRLAEARVVEDRGSMTDNLHKMILKTAFSGFFQVDMQGRIIEVNDAYCQMSGYTEEELLNMKISDVESLEDGNAVRDRIERLKKEGKVRFESKHRRKDGTVYDIEISLQYYAEGGFIVGFGRDVTEHKQLENKLRESEEMFAMFMRHSPAYVYIKEVTPTESCTLRASDNFHKMVGQPVSEIIGKTMSEVFPADFAAKITAEDWAVVSSDKVMEQEEEFAGKHYITTKFPIYVGGKTLLAGYTLDTTERKKVEDRLRESEERYRTLFDTSQDAIMIIEPPTWKFTNCNKATISMFQTGSKEMFTSTSPWALSPEFQSDGRRSDVKAKEMIQTAVRDGSNFFEWLHKRLSGEVFPATVLLTKVVLGAHVFLQATVRDHTEQRALEERLRQSEKLDAVGKLAGGIAHDFNNQLVGIIGYSEMLKRDPGHPLAGKFAANILEAGNRSASLVKQLLAFARKGELSMAPVNMTQLVREVADIAERTFDKRINVRVVTDNGATIVGDSASLHNAVLNLALNARDAMPNGGTLCFSTEFMESCHDLPSLEEGCLKIAVSDTGTGMTEETRKRIFEPFFTTKEIGKGTGLGLASVYGTVLSHKGTIKVDSVVGKGSTFTFFLPMRKSPTNSWKVTERKMIKAVRPATIMVVDDDDRVRALFQDILDGLEYTVVDFADPADALHFYRHNADTVALCLLDMSMPTMDGGSLFAAMKNINPSVKAMIVSGHSFDESIQAVVAAGALGHIAKPFNTVAISEKIAEALK